MNSDFKDLFRILGEEDVRLLVVGGYAVIHYAQPRYTKDLDIWIEPTAANAQRSEPVLASPQDLESPIDYKW